MTLIFSVKGLGIIKAGIGSSNNIASVIPVDFVADMLIVAAAYEA